MKNQIDQPEKHIWKSVGICISFPPFHISRKARRELCVDDVTRHLAFAFNEFLERQKNKEGVDENKQAVISQAKELLASAFDLPEDSNDESLKVK